MLQEFSRNTKFLDIIIHLNLRNLVCREDSDRLLGERISKPLPTCLCTHAQHPGPCPLSTVERLDVTCGLTEGMAHMSFPHKLVFLVPVWLQATSESWAGHSKEESRGKLGTYLLAGS